MLSNNNNDNNNNSNNNISLGFIRGMTPVLVPVSVLSCSSFDHVSCPFPATVADESVYGRW